MPEKTAPARNPRRQSWKQDPEAVRADILRAATEEFAAKGFKGTRIDDIVARTQTSKRMIFYYFDDKDTLYRTVLEQAYSRIRTHEAALDLTGLPPEKALARLVAFTFEYHRQDPDFIRLVMIENIHRARQLKASDSVAHENAQAIERLSTLIDEGIAAGRFRADLDPLELHWLISALSFHNVSNMFTFQHIFGDALHSKAGQHTLCRHVVSTVLRSVLIDTHDIDTLLDD
ncbi:TetR/AcrR family transcriptional regulator [Donghicola tyrosinivorans]|uniref:TetR/AcrR family transcriptional regulator n=1 Tax=Donghicola tyrosinivorans TaxID=1652492 RepID=UPI000D059A73|nr:TetR/AcrR family transcriptional regulator [Donghicola tyrosinivorans]